VGGVSAAHVQAPAAGEEQPRVLPPHLV
jgi:hypothetical protein